MRFIFNFRFKKQHNPQDREDNTCQNATKMYLDERDCSVRVVDGLYHSLRGHKVSDTLRSGQVVLGGGRGYLMVFKCVQQILAAVLLVAVLNDGPQRLRPRHLGKHKYKLIRQIILQIDLRTTGIRFKLV